MKTIAIVGLGWFGLPLAESLKLKEFKVFGTTTTKEKINQFNQIEVKLLNLNQAFNEKEMIDFFKLCSICVINIPPSKSLFYSYQNQILSLISLFDASCKFIFISSTSVYSDAIIEAKEDTPILTDYNYTSQLFLTEKALKLKLNNRLTILRFAGLVGANRNPANFLAGKTNLANGDSPVNLVHLTDCISFVEKVIDKNSWGEIYNVCSSFHPSRKEYYTKNCIKNKLEVPTFVDGNEIKKIVKNEKGIQKLNFKYSFDSPFEF